MTTPDTEETQSENAAVAEGSLETGQETQEQGTGAGIGDGAGAGIEAEPVPEPEPVEPPKYRISFRRLEELNRSAVMLVAARLVESCPSMAKPLTDLKDPQVLITEISRHYQDDPDYIRTDMPLMEIVFRIFLSRKNELISLTDLHYELTERWATPVRPINVTEEGLERVLDADTYYGFAREDAG